MRKNQFLGFGDIDYRTLGRKIKDVFSSMGCKQIPDQEHFNTLVKHAVGTFISPYGLPRDGYHYEIDVGQLPEFFKTLEQVLEEKIPGIFSIKHTTLAKYCGLFYYKRS